MEREVTRLYYDGLGRRLAKEYDPKTGAGGVKRTEYVFDGLDPVVEYSLWNGQRDEFYRGGLEAFSPTPMLLEMRHFPAGAEGQAYWYHLDGRGSVAGLTKHQGQSTHNYRYDAYGQLLPAHGNWTDPHNHYTFAGKEWDEHLGLYEFGVRLYDPWAGIWLTREPMPGRAWEPRTWHRYQYAYANPISYYDSYGLQGEGPTGAYPPECVPLWARILSFPYRLIPWNFCLPGTGWCWGGTEYAEWLETQYYPQLPSLLKWIWYHPAQAWGLPSTSLKTLMIEDWFFELGEPVRYYYEDHPATRLLMHHEGVEYYRQKFYQSGYQDIVRQPWDAGEGAKEFQRLWIEIKSHLRVGYEVLFLVEDNPETVRGTLGSYWVTVRRVDHEAEFIVENLTGRESFLRTPWGPLMRNQEREETQPTWFSEQGWGGNMWQFFIWREPLP